MKEDFEIYTEAYGKVKSGRVLNHQDFGYLNTDWVDYNERQKVAIALGAEDAKNRLMRSKSEVKEEMDKRLS